MICCGKVIAVIMEGDIVATGSVGSLDSVTSVEESAPEYNNILDNANWCVIIGTNTLLRPDYPSCPVNAIQIGQVTWAI